MSDAVPGDARLCCMCQREPAGAKSHIIPRGLYKLIDPGLRGGVRMFTDDPAEPEQRRFAGAHDRTIMCHACELRFQRHDDYAIKSLRVEPVVPAHWFGPHDRELRGVDAGRLAMFFLHVLWRAHESQLPDFGAVDLGQCAEDLRERLFRDDAGACSVYPTVLAQLPRDLDGMHLMMAPRPIQWPSGVGGFLIQIERWMVSTTIGSVPSEIAPYVLEPGKPTLIQVGGGRTYRESPGWMDGLEAVEARMAREES